MDVLFTFGEGIAQATGQGVEAASVFDSSLFETGLVSSITSQLASFVLTKPASHVHALAVLGQIAKDPDFAPSAIGLPVPHDEHESSVDRVVRVAGEKLLKLTKNWVAGLHPDAATLTPQLLSKRFEEIVWMNTVIYAVGGWAGRKQGEDEKQAFNGDFFL